jgi:hypothetical protein
MTPQPGMVLVLADDQYRFGVGPLLCRVVEVIAPVLFDEVLWWHVSGECAYGTVQRHGGWQARELYVVGSAVVGHAGGDRGGGRGRVGDGQHGADDGMASR